MRTENLTESRPALLNLDDNEAEALLRVGKALASKSAWWGGQSGAEQGRSVVRCAPSVKGKWSVCVSDAIGIISTGDLQLVVQPKIPQDHLLHILGEAEVIPRLDPERALAAKHAGFWELVAGWFVDASELLLRRELLSDYEEHAAWIRSKRGRIDVIRTARANAAGRIGLHCMYDDYSVDTPLNRVIKSAASAVLSSASLPIELRRRARAVWSRMENTGILVSTDLTVRTDRRSSYYADAFLLAKHIIVGQGRGVAEGDCLAKTFLIRTPEVVESGLRAILRRSKSRAVSVEKKGVGVGGGLTFTPDLVIASGAAVADVKYKVFGSEWSRQDLYQVVAFGKAFEAQHAAVIGFSTTQDGPIPKTLSVGSLELRPLAWRADPTLSASDAERLLVTSFYSWLSDVGIQPAQAA